MGDRKRPGMKTAVALHLRSPTAIFSREVASVLQVVTKPAVEDASTISCVGVFILGACAEGLWYLSCVCVCYESTHS